MALNLGAQSQRLTLPARASDCRLLLSTVTGAPLIRDGVLLLRPDEGVILDVG